VASSTQLIFDIFAKDHNTSQVFEGIGGSVTKLAGMLGVAFGGAELVKGVEDMVKAAGDFEAANTRLVTSAGESAANLKIVGDGILQVAQDTGTTVENLEQGAYYIESAGFHGADMLNVLKAAAQGAKAEGSSVQVVGDAVTSALRDYHLSASDAADVTSKLITATSQGKTTFELFSGSLHSVLPLASAAHISLNDILGDLASMTVHGMSADQATQNLNDTIRHLLNPTQQQTKEFALFGLTAQGVSDSLSSKGLSGTLDMLQGKIMAAMPPGSDKVLLDMKTALSELDPKVQELGQHLFDGSMGWKEWLKQARDLDPVHEKQITQLATLLGSTHALGNEQKTGEDVLQNYAQAWRLLTGDATGANTALMLTGENADYTHGAIAAVAGATKDAAGNVKGWSEIQDTFNTKLDKAKEVFETTAIKIGSKLLPALGDAVGKFTEFVQDVAPQLSGLWTQDIQPAMDHIAASFLGVFGDSSGDTGTTGNAADGFHSAMVKVGTDANGTLGKDGTVAKAAKDFADSVRQITDAIKTVTDGLHTLDEGTNTFLHGLDPVVTGIHEDVAQMVSDFGGGITNIVSFFGSAGGAIGNFFGQMGSDFAGGIEHIREFVGTAVADIQGFQWQVLGAMAGAGGWLLNAGFQIIGGLITGIENAMSGPLSVVLDAVGQFIKDHKGPPEYDKVMLKPHGGWIMGGLIDGIEGSLPDLGVTLAKVTGTVAGAFDMSPAVPMGSASAAFGGGGAQTLYLVLEDGRQLKGYVSSVAGRAIDSADFRGARRPSL
jgi:TP901 family phage tail tape measure protein